MYKHLKPIKRTSIHKGILLIFFTVVVYLLSTKTCVFPVCLLAFFKKSMYAIRDWLIGNLDFGKSFAYSVLFTFLFCTQKLNSDQWQREIGNQVFIYLIRIFYFANIFFISIQFVAFILTESIRSLHNKY